MVKSVSQPSGRYPNRTGCSGATASAPFSALNDTIKVPSQSKNSTLNIVAGSAVGSTVGSAVGSTAGLAVGSAAGSAVGSTAGSAIGSAVGSAVGSAGSAVGSTSGESDGSDVGQLAVPPSTANPVGTNIMVTSAIVITTDKNLFVFMAFLLYVVYFFQAACKIKGRSQL